MLMPLRKGNVGHVGGEGVSRKMKGETENRSLFSVHTQQGYGATRDSVLEVCYLDGSQGPCSIGDQTQASACKMCAPI